MKIYFNYENFYHNSHNSEDENIDCSHGQPNHNVGINKYVVAMEDEK